MFNWLAFNPSGRRASSERFVTTYGLEFTEIE
jgi:hypothetical protein